VAWSLRYTRPAVRPEWGRSQRAAASASSSQP